MHFQFVVKTFISISLAMIFIHSLEKDTLESEIYVDGVIDRIVNNEIAIIIIQEKQIQLQVPINELPDESKVGTWLTLVVSNGDFTVLAIDEDKTESQCEKMQSIYQQIRLK